MARGERPLITGDDVLLRFAAGLRDLRRAASSPTYRELSRRAHFSISTLSSAASGRQLPSLSVTLAYVRACDGDAGEWERRWHEAALALAPTAVPADGLAPYVGLAAYEPQDADRFRGRDRLVESLTARVRRQRFVAVFGASGTGKSSLLRAGLVTRWRTHGPAVLLTPGPHPMKTLTTRLAQASDTANGKRNGDSNATPQGLHRALQALLADQPDDAHLLLVIDQFEEVFTLCRDHDARTDFIAGLLSAAADPDSRCRVVLGVRADFYAHCTRHPDLVGALADAQVPIGPMTNDELRHAIVRPAVEAGCTLETALVAELLAQSAGNAGALPLLSHALLETWRRRRGTTLTLAAFRAAGGIDGALAHTAESVFSGLGPAARTSVRQLFLRLTALGEGTEDTKRRVSRTELDDGATAVLDVLAENRLITVSAETVEIAHEALIQAWPRLRRWLTDDRAGLRIHRALTDAAQDWAASGRDPDALYRGTRLSTATGWASSEDRGLNPVEQEFLDASAERETRARRAALRRVRRARYLTGALAVMLVITTAAGLVAFAQREGALQLRQLALSRQLAAQALALVDSAPGTAKLLSVEAYRAAPTVEARGALLSMSAHREYRTEIPAHTGAVSEVAFTPQGALLSAGRDGTASVWQATRRIREATLTGHDAWLLTLAVNQAGTTAATGGVDGRIVLWDLPQRSLTGALGEPGTEISDVKFSPDGRLLAAASDDGRIRLWELPTHTLQATLTGHTGRIRALSFSSDGSTLASAGADGTVRLWSSSDHSALATLPAHTEAVRTVAFSPDGRTLASAGTDGTVALWDASTRARIATLTGHTDEVFTVAFSPDGRTLASAGTDSVVRLWNTHHRTLRATLAGHHTNLYTLAFSPADPALLATGGEDGRIMLWDTAATPITNGPVNDIAFTSDGSTIVAGGPGRATLWDTTSRIPRDVLDLPGTIVNSIATSPDGRTIAAGTESVAEPVGPEGNDLVLSNPHSVLHGHEAAVHDVAFSPDGRIAATASADQTVGLWDVERRTRTASFDIGAITTGVAFSPDGRTLATADHDNQLIILWDVVMHARKAEFRGHTGWARTVVFSPDGTTLASSSADETVIVWDVATGTQVAKLSDHQDADFTGVAYSPDGTSLAYAGVGNTIVLWDVRSRTLKARLTAHADSIQSLAFGPDGRTLATAATDDNIILWDTDPDNVTQRICTDLSRNLTDTEWLEYIPEVPRRDTCPT
ncbi:nSTAND1 domain-containing NTPase [Amycolatopsis magusensis]|uniref:nSTAND1 domain-containing NTPase n=1 Tax=Amycolatopsis magusensis TaxID=882444 RepID=UPI0024A83EF3|nr:AAA family ATPase [Amycolatopsis magusensis]MDI5979846.1 hypothetical protein [Amycolatopsis magusensis]